MNFTKKILSLSLAAILTFGVLPTVNVSAAKKNSKQTKTQRQVKKSQNKKRNTTKKAKNTKVKKVKKTASRGKVYSRGSGAPLANGDEGQVLQVAKSLLGTRYSYGGTTPRGFDCSGFTQYVYRQLGVNIPRTASGQAQVGLAVDKNELKPGDLVFFETVREGISHVGIYIGDGKFIHASSGKSNKVTITSLNESYYVSRYRGAVRIIR